MASTSLPKSDYAYLLDYPDPNPPFWRQFLLDVLQQGPIPQHVAIIMDGNRRYSQQHGIPTAHGHEKGGQSMTMVADMFFRLGVKVVTLYAFSIENFKRPKEQVDTILEIMRYHISEWEGEDIRESENLHDTQIRFLGRMDLLPPDIREYFAQASARTKHRTGTILNICAPYTARDEITTAVRRLVKDCRDGESELCLEGITAQALTERMFTGDNPPLDILIRTSGVWRLSDFMLWQCHENTAIEIVDTLCPDFGIWDMLWVLVKWQSRMCSVHSCKSGMDVVSWSIAPIWSWTVVLYSILVVHLGEWLV